MEKASTGDAATGEEEDGVGQRPVSSEWRPRRGGGSAEKSHEVDQARSVRPWRGCLGTQAWRSGTSATATASRARHAAEQRRLSVSDGEDEKWSWLLLTPSQRVRTRRPCTWVVKTGGVQSLLHHRSRCCSRTLWRLARAVKHRLRLTGGPQLHFVISKNFNHPNFEIRIGDLPNVQSSRNFVDR
jgi:hypothetical protein